MRGMIERRDIRRGTGLGIRINGLGEGTDDAVSKGVFGHGERDAEGIEGVVFVKGDGVGLVFHEILCLVDVLDDVSREDLRLVEEDDLVREMLRLLRDGLKVVADEHVMRVKAFLSCLPVKTHVGHRKRTSHLNP